MTSRSAETVRRLVTIARARFDPIGRRSATVRHAMVAIALVPGLAVSGVAAAAPARAVLFVHVNVVPMDRERVMHDQSVLVENGVITAIGSRLKRSKSVRVVDGQRKLYLSPGLADMHVHSTTSRDMLLYLANGVTTVLNMGGERSAFMDSVVPRLNVGDLPGPHVYSSFKIDGTPEYNEFVVATPTQARAIVDIAKTNGYDFIKVYNNIAADTFQALVDAGREKGVPVIGHGVTSVGIERQLAAGQVMVAHAEEYLYTVFFPPGGGVGNEAPGIDKIPAAVAFTKRYRAYVTADLNTYATLAAQWGRPAVVSTYLAAPEVRYLDPDDRIAWRRAGYAEKTGSLDARLLFLRTFIKALSDSGVPLLAGTDAPSIPGLIPGFSLHAEVRALEAAGLTRYQTLLAATRTPGEFIARTKPGGVPFGTVTVGARADLILSQGNPLDDLSTLEKPLGVMGHGRWYSHHDLKAMVDGLAATYAEAVSP